MPFYEFKCQKCSLRFEKSLSIKDDHSKVVCLSCSGATQKLPPKNVGTSMKEPTHMAKDIDKAVGADSEKRWMEYEDRKNIKEKVRKEFGTQRLSKDPDGNYTPVAVTVDGKAVSEESAVNIRKQMYKEYDTIRKDPETTKVKLEE